MTPAETTTILRQFNEWRRGDFAPSEQPEPPELCAVSLAIDDAVAMIDRLDAVEKERDELRAKVDAMERQEPVMWVNSSNIDSSRINKERGGHGDQHTCSEKQTTYHNTPLYALPGVKEPEPTRD